MEGSGKEEVKQKELDGEEEAANTSESTEDKSSDPEPTVNLKTKQSTKKTSRDATTEPTETAEPEPDFTEPDEIETFDEHVKVNSLKPLKPPNEKNMVSKARIRAIGEYFKKLLFKMEKEDKDLLKKEAKKVEVQIIPQQMREDGLILFKFNQKLILPEFVKRIKQGRLLAGTEFIKSFS